MIITGRRIRNLALHLGSIPEGQRIVLGVAGLDRFADQINQFGFPENPDDGTTVLPPPSFGPVSRFNAEGKYIIHRDQEKETVYRQVEWHWKEWNGRYETTERSKIVDVPYQRYPRTFVPPPSIELMIITDNFGDHFLITQEIEFTATNHQRILHIVNLLLAIFGECHILGSQFENFAMPQVRRINWRILPPGKRPWSQLVEELRPIIEQEPQNKQPVIIHRLQTVNAYNPDFRAIGTGGFNGYVVFGFPERHMFILECVRYGNATYVFGDDWETLAQMTKAEILDENRQRARLIHLQGWEEHLKGLFR